MYRNITYKYEKIQLKKVFRFRPEELYWNFENIEFLKPNSVFVEFMLNTLDKCALFLLCYAIYKMIILGNINYFNIKLFLNYKLIIMIFRLV